MTIAEMLAMVVCVFLNVLLETTIVVNINIFGILPDTIVAATVAIALVSGPLKGAFYGMVCGLVIDILFGSVTGIYSIVYAFTGIIAGAACNKYFSTNLVFAFIAAAVLYILKEGAMLITLKVQGYDFAAGGMFWRFLLPAALFTGLLNMPVYYIYRRYKQYELRRMKYR